MASICKLTEDANFQVIKGPTRGLVLRGKSARHSTAIPVLLVTQGNESKCDMAAGLFTFALVLPLGKMGKLSCSYCLSSLAMTSTLTTGQEVTFRFNQNNGKYRNTCLATFFFSLESLSVANPNVANNIMAVFFVCPLISCRVPVNVCFFQVREQANSTLVTVYCHVGERIRGDLEKKGVPAARYVCMSVLTCDLRKCPFLEM